MANKYDDATTLEKADRHIWDARANVGNAGQTIVSAVGDLQTAHGLSNNNLGHRLKSEDLIAIAQVKATLALVKATLAVAHSNIGNYLLEKSSIVGDDISGIKEWLDGNSGSKEIPEATPEAAE